MTSSEFSGFVRRTIFAIAPTTLAVPVSLGVFVGGALVAFVDAIAPHHHAPDWGVVCFGVSLVSVPWVLLGKHRRIATVTSELEMLDRVLKRGKLTKEEKREVYRRVAQVVVTAIETGNWNDEVGNGKPRAGN